MSYLWMQILICLLIAGLIGLVIGWLLRGGCKGKLEDQAQLWSNKLNKSNLLWEEKIQKIDLEQQTVLDAYKGEKTRLEENLRIQEEKNRALGVEQGALAEKSQALKATSKNEVDRWKIKCQNLEDSLLTQERIYKENRASLKREIEDLAFQARDLREKDSKKIEALQSKLLFLETQAKSKEDEFQQKLRNNDLSWKSKIEVNKKTLDKMDVSEETELEKEKTILNLKRNLHKTKAKGGHIQKIKRYHLTKEEIEANKDNLQLIKGIGEVLEKSLNEHNVYQFKQIASWDEKIIDEFSHIFAFTGRIEREEWVKQAQELEEKKKRD